MRVSKLEAMFLVLALNIALCGTVVAAEVASAPFSFGYGWSPTNPANTDVRSWNTNETSASNTPSTIGDFSFAPAPFGGNFSATGISFPNRVLTNRGNYSAIIDNQFVVPVTASYTGVAPAGVSGTPNYKLRLEISKLSVWVGDHNSANTDGMATWIETTQGHESTSPVIAVTKSNDFNEARVYSQLVWDPSDYDVPLAGLNDGSTRTFRIPNTSSLRYADGLEIEGRVVLVFDAVPEPATLSLLVMACAAAGTMFLRRRR